MTATESVDVAKTKAAQNALDLRMIPIGEIAADPGQPRKTFDRAALVELGESLTQGQTNPIKVRPRHASDDFPTGINWVLVHGERRWRAAQIGEIPRLRAEVAWNLGIDDANAGTVLLEQIADNLQRVDLGAVEEAAGIRRYAELSGLGTKELAAQIGKNPMYVSLAIGMGDMPATIVKRIEADAKKADGSEDAPAPLSWRHLRQLVRLKDEPALLEHVYDDLEWEKPSARELEQTVTQELDHAERLRERQAADAKAAEKAKASGKPAPAPKVDGPMSHMSEKAKREALEKARMTRVRKDLIRGNVPEIVRQVGEIANKFALPEGLVLAIAGRVSGYDVSTSHASYTQYSENIAALVVRELPGRWNNVRLGSATNAGRWAKDDEAGRQWLAFAYWLATETKGLDADLDRQSRDVLKKRDQAVPKAAVKGAKKKTKAAAASKEPPRQCARVDCVKVFHVKQGPGRKPKYCDEHRSK